MFMQVSFVRVVGPAPTGVKCVHLTKILHCSEMLWYNLRTNINFVLVVAHFQEPFWILFKTLLGKGLTKNPKGFKI